MFSKRVPMNQTARKYDSSPETEVAGSRSENHVSLENVHGSVAVPHHLAGFWEQWRAFVGPAILVSVGYMDPGNWGTDLQAGAQFKYALLWVVGLASVMAIFMQVMSARLGVVTGKDLAQCCRDWYPGWTRWPNWLMSEVAIAACDLAEVLGSAVALNLLFHIHCSGPSLSPHWMCCCSSVSRALGCEPLRQWSCCSLPPLPLAISLKFLFFRRRGQASWRWETRC